MSIEPLIGGLIRNALPSNISRLLPIEPLIGGLILAGTRNWVNASLPIEPLIGGLRRPCGSEELEMRNEQSTIIFLG